MQLYKFRIVQLSLLISRNDLSMYKRNVIIYSLSCILLLVSGACNKDVDDISNLIEDEYVKYTIVAGEQYCDKNPYTPVSVDELKFLVKFDSTTVYKTKDTLNQHSINKLYGFSDNNAYHHEFSARVGWRWKDNELHLFSYDNNNSISTLDWSKDLGKVEIGHEINCSIKVKADAYMFTVNGKTETIPRASKTAKAEGYKLYPYFGGNETASHNIMIWIKDVD